VEISKNNFPGYLRVRFLRIFLGVPQGILLLFYYFFYSIPGDAARGY